MESLARLRSRSRIIDGEAVCCGDDGVPSFDRIRYRRHDASVFLCAFDLIELDGDDLRPETFETRKATLASLLKPWPAAERAHRGRRTDCVRAPCKMGPRRYRLEAQDLDVSQPLLAGLDQEQEPGLRAGAARGGERLGPNYMNAYKGACWDAFGRINPTWRSLAFQGLWRASAVGRSGLFRPINGTTGAAYYGWEQDRDAKRLAASIAARVAELSSSNWPTASSAIAMRSWARASRRRRSTRVSIGKARTS